MYIIEIHGDAGKINEHEMTSKPTKDQIKKIAEAYDDFKYAKVEHVYKKSELESEEK